MLTIRQRELLRLILKLKTPNVSALIVASGSADRIKRDLAVLCENHYARMQPQGKKEKIYSPTEEGAGYLAKFDGQEMNESLMRLTHDVAENEQLKKRVKALERIAQRLMDMLLALYPELKLELEQKTG